MINGLGLVTAVAGWAGARAAEAADRNLSPRRAHAGGGSGRLARGKDALMAATFVSGAATGALGMRFAKEGATPLVDGDTPAPDAPERAVRMKRALNALGLVSIGSELGLVAVNAALNQEGFRRPPLRRRLWKRPY